LQSSADAGIGASFQLNVPVFPEKRVLLTQMLEVQGKPDQTITHKLNWSEAPRRTYNKCMSDSNCQQELPDDSTIDRALREQGNQALAEYFSAFEPRLKQIIRFRLDRRLHARVSESDVIQETYVRAAKRIDHFLEQPDLPFFVWLRLEVQQKLHELHRFHLGAAKRDARAEVNLSPAKKDHGQTSMCLAHHLAAQITSPSLVVQREEQLEFLKRALDEMNETDREVIALRHFEELSNVETAKVLGLQPSAASKRYLRALKRVGEILKEAQQFDESTGQ
jgi:RNA polymerase sigma-70 factor (ECF subfamily)